MPTPRPVTVKAGVHRLAPYPPSPPPVKPLKAVVPRADGGLPVLDAALKATRLARAFADGRLTDTQRNRLGRAIASRAKAAARSATVDLVKGRVTLSQWQRAMKAGILASHAAATRARLGTRALAPDDRNSLERHVARQFTFLDRFARQIKSGEFPLGPRAVARAGLYGSASWATAEGVMADKAKREGLNQARSVLGLADHCGSCLTEASKGWMSPDDIVPIGDRECRSNCRCHLEYRRKPDATVVEPDRPVPAAEPRPQPPAPIPPPAPIGPIEARRQRVAERLRTLPAEIRAAHAEEARLREELKKIESAGLPFAEELRLGKPYFAALDRTKALEAQHQRLQSWETLRKDVPTLVPAGPIGERVRDYMEHEGGAKSKTLLEAVRPHADRLAVLDARRGTIRAELSRAGDDLYKLESQVMSSRGKKKKEYQDQLDALQARRQELQTERDRIGLEAEEVKARRLAAMADALEVERPATIHQERMVSSDGGRPLDRPDAAFQATIDRSVKWVETITHATDGTPLGATFGTQLGARAHYKDDFGGDGNILLSPGDDPGVVVHEVGHLIEYRMRLGGEPVVRRSQEFLAHRVGDEVPVEMQTLATGAYEPGEKGRSDKFGEAFPGTAAYYVGKDYGNRATEILSMGIQKLHDDPVTFAEKDPEYFHYVLGVLDGSLR